PADDGLRRGALLSRRPRDREPRRAPDGARVSFVWAGIIAAGEGSRLRRDGFAAHKPLVEVAGVPLVEHAIGNLAASGARRIVVIVNEEQRDCARWLERSFTGLDID